MLLELASFIEERWANYSKVEKDNNVISDSNKGGNAHNYIIMSLPVLSISFIPTDQFQIGRN